MRNLTQKRFALLCVLSLSVISFWPDAVASADANPGLPTSQSYEGRGPAWLAMADRSSSSSASSFANATADRAAASSSGAIVATSDSSIADDFINRWVYWLPNAVQNAINADEMQYLSGDESQNPCELLNARDKVVEQSSLTAKSSNFFSIPLLCQRIATVSSLENKLAIEHAQLEQKYVGIRKHHAVFSTAAHDAELRTTRNQTLVQLLLAKRKYLIIHHANKWRLQERDTMRAQLAQNEEQLRQEKIEWQKRKQVLIDEDLRLKSWLEACRSPQPKSEKKKYRRSKSCER